MGQTVKRGQTAASLEISVHGISFYSSDSLNESRTRVTRHASRISGEVVSYDITEVIVFYPPEEVYQKP
jgi:hypothetical protein